jgi:hypothetical protein
MTTVGFMRRPLKHFISDRFDWKGFAWNRTEVLKACGVRRPRSVPMEMPMTRFAERDEILFGVVAVAAEFLMMKLKVLQAASGRARGSRGAAGRRHRGRFCSSSPEAVAFEMICADFPVGVNLVQRSDLGSSI